MLGNIYYSTDCTAPSPNTDSLFDAQVGQGRVQEGERLMHWVGLHLNGQCHRHEDVQLQLHPHHRALWPRRIPASRLVRPSVPPLPGQAFYLVGCQLDFLISISKKDAVHPLALGCFVCVPDAAYLHLLSAAGVVADTSGWSPFLLGCVPCDGKASGKGLVSAVSAPSLADVGSWREGVLCATQMLGLLGCQM